MVFGFKNPFAKKGKPLVQEIPKLELPKPSMSETSTTDNMKAKMDLVLTQLESLNVRYETLNQRLSNIERMVQEIYVIAKR